ncbi:hypothetical protein D3C80_1066120 [compost metagenome]
MGQRQAAAAVAEVFGGLVVDHRFTGALGHGAVAQGAQLTDVDRVSGRCLTQLLARAAVGQAGSGVKPQQDAGQLHRPTQVLVDRVMTDPLR